MDHYAEKITKDDTLSRKIKVFHNHNQIKYLKNENVDLSDKVHDFEKNCLMLYKKGQYSNYITSVCEDLLCIGSVNVS